MQMMDSSALNFKYKAPGRLEELDGLRGVAALMLGTANLNGLDPAAWLRDTLEKLPSCLNSEIDSLSPLRIEPLHPSMS